MSIFDIFKKKARKARRAPRVEQQGKKEKIKEAPTLPPEAPSESEERRGEVKAVPTKPKRKKKFADAYRILKEPHVTEKATDLTAKNQYIFKIWPRSNKIEIKKAVESLYGVDVIDVKIIKVPSKKRRVGRIEGQRKGYKKAIVKIREGQKIEVLPR